MTLTDLAFLASVLLVMSLLVWIAVCAARRKWSGMRRVASFAGLFLAGHAIVLVTVALLMPRRFLVPGERRCFDDWCVAALSAERKGNMWVATLEVSSEARRVRQRAWDAVALLEDTEGRRYDPCGSPLRAGGGPPRMLSDELGPGESFRVLQPFCLPEDTHPAGVVVHHGAFPGIIIIGDDQSFLHPPALARVAVAP